MRKIILFLLFSLFTLSADELWNLTQKGQKEYKAGNYDAALEHFNEAALKYPESSEALYNKGLALAALGNLEEAGELFNKISFSDSLKEAERLYSKGHLADLKADLARDEQKVGEAKKAYIEAIQNYAKALDKNPNLADAQHNVALTSKKLKALPPEPEQQQQQNQDQDSKDNKDQQDSKDKQDQENKDQNQDQQQDEKKKDQQDQQESDDKKDQDEKKKDQQDQEKEEDQKKGEEKQNQGDEDEEKKDEQKEQQAQPQKPQDLDEQKKQQAMRLLQQYADDAKDLNKPQKIKGVVAPNGKDW